VRAASRPARLAVALLTSSVIVGCGSRTVTKRDYVARADAICASALRSLRAAGPASSLSAYLGSAVPILRSQDHQLRALPAPSQSAADRATLSRYLAALDADLRSYQALQSAAQAGNAEAATGAESALRVSPTTTLAARYGLRDCAAPSATVS
jgi:hypothetical protein